VRAARRRQLAWNAPLGAAIIIAGAVLSRVTHRTAGVAAAPALAPGLIARRA
jgi:hypothetical protein